MALSEDFIKFQTRLKTSQGAYRQNAKSRAGLLGAEWEVVYHNLSGKAGIVKIRRRTRIAVQIDEKLLVRSHQGGNSALSAELPVSAFRDCLSLLKTLQKEGQAAPGGMVSQIKKQKEEPSCNDESK